MGKKVILFFTYVFLEKCSDVDIEIIDKDTPRSLHDLYPNSSEKVIFTIKKNLKVSQTKRTKPSVKTVFRG